MITGEYQVMAQLDMDILLINTVNRADAEFE